MRWQLYVMLGGTDVSGRLTGTVTVEAEEGTARIAELKLLPYAGPISLTSYVGQSITIDYVPVEPAGAPVRLFTGVVDVPEYDPRTRTTSLRCTDDFQTKANTLVFGQGSPFFNLVTGAVYSDAIFGVMTKRSAWHVLQDAMSTLPADYSLDTQGNPQYTPWAAKTAADYTYTESNIIDKTLGVTYATRQSIKNTVKIDFQYRFDRLHQRVAKYHWQHPGICYSLTHGGDIPTTAMLKDAISSAGWDVLNFSIQNPPPSGWYYCGTNQSAWVVDETSRKSLAYVADIYLTKRFARQVTDHYYLSVQSNASQTRLGSLVAKLSGTLDASFDASAWEQNINRGPVIIPLGATEGEYICDRTDITEVARDDANKAVKCLVQQAQTQILASHRQNFVDLTVPVEAAIDRVHTVYVQTATVQAQGKVRQLVHTLDLNSGSALTKLRLAISRVDALGLEDATTDPDVPSGPPVPTPLSAEDMVTNLGNHYGGVDAPATDASYGHITNAAGYSVNPHEFRIPTFTIPASEQAAVESSILSDYTVAIKDELLIVSA